MSGSSHIQSVLIGDKYRNCCRTLDVYFTTKLLSAEVNNSQVILRIVLPILTKFLQKSQIPRALLQEVAKHFAE